MSALVAYKRKVKVILIMMRMDLLMQQVDVVQPGLIANGFFDDCRMCTDMLTDCPVPICWVAHVAAINEDMS